MSADLTLGPEVFVDTNVLVYAFDVTAGHKRARALSLLSESWGRTGASLSVQVLQEFYVTVTRKLKRPLALENAHRIVASLSHWQVHAPQAADVLAAIDLHATAQLSFWDSMIITSAAQLNCRVLLSEDLSAGQEIAGVTIVNPFS